MAKTLQYVPIMTSAHLSFHCCFYLLDSRWLTSGRENSNSFYIVFWQILGEFLHRRLNNNKAMRVASIIFLHLDVFNKNFSHKYLLIYFIMVPTYNSSTLIWEIAENYLSGIIYPTQVCLGTPQKLKIICFIYLLTTYLIFLPYNR